MNKYKYKKPIYAIREDSDESNSNNSDNDGKNKQLWCICRSEDGARFMICCDSCEEWYHGDCVNITPKQSELISKYFCAQCQKKNPSLKIEYKPGIAIKRPKDVQQPSKVDKAFKSKSDEKISDNSQLKYDKLHKVKIEEKLMDPSQSKFYKVKTEEKVIDTNQSKFEKFSKHKHEEKFEFNHSKYDKSHKIKSEDRLMDLSITKDTISNSKFDKLSKIKSEEKITETVIKFSQKPVKPGSCGECIGCLRKFDCNVCQNCKTKSDKGCLKRVCQLTTSNNEKIIKAEKLMLTKLPGEFIPTKVVPPPKKQTLIRDLPFSKTNLPSSSSPSSNENQPKAQKRQLSPSTSSESNSIISAKQKNSQINSSNFNKLPPKRMKLDSESNFQKSTKKFIESSESSDLDEHEDIEDGDMEDESGGSDDSDDENEDSSGSFVLRKNTKASTKIVPNSIKKKIAQPNLSDKNEMMSDSPYVKHKFPRKPAQSKIPENLKQYKPSQCHNLGCTRLNRLGSKYCSDECGIKLAEQRLLKYLPSRISNWNNTVSICNLKDRRTQAAIQEECETIQYNLNILDKSHHDLIEFIDRWRSSCSASSNADDDDRRISGVNDDSVQCVTCGYMIASTKALAHMENCYQKIEGGTMVFADFEEQPIGSKLFCDFYDNNIRGYCKRLAALCDHNKDAKVDPKTICAFPLSVNEKSDKVCMTAKVKCNRHVNWERIQRAVIDMNRYRLLVRYEELQVEERKFKHNIAQRGGVMSLLLHDTIDHQPLKPLVPNRNKERNNKMKKFTKAMCI